MKKRMMLRLAALALALCLLPAGAQALTPQQTVELLEQYYVDPVPAAVYEQDTVEGILETLGDRYTEYFTAEEYTAFTDSMEDTQVVGVGVVVSVDERGLLVNEVVAGGGAEEAGLLAGDVITAVDGQSVAGVDLDAASGMLRGEEGTQVTLTVLRGQESFTAAVARRKVVVPTTTTQLVDGHIGYIECTTFGGSTKSHFEEGIAQYDSVVDHWIVDLRDNGGGVVQSSVDAAGCFTGPGKLAYLRGGDGNYYYNERVDEASTISPVIVLTNAYSASASELFAAAIRDTGAGLVVGGRTYGKGVAQRLLDKETHPDYFPDGDALKVTVYRNFSAEYLSTTDQIGVIPHLLISDENAAAAAMLLCALPDLVDTEGLLRLDLKWRWYIDLDTALSPDYRAAFVELLEAIPAGAGLYLGAGGLDAWEETTPAAVAEHCGLTEYVGRGFPDVAESPYAQQIDTLKVYGVVNGAGDGQYYPEGKLTRGELCQMLVNAMRYPAAMKENHFPDVDPAGDWFAGAVDAASAAGIVNGATDGQFYPDGLVTHQELITMLGRAGVRLSANLYEDERAGTAEYSAAVSAYPDWARSYVWLLTECYQDEAGEAINFLWDDPANIDPAAPATRGETAALLYNILAFTGVLEA